MSPKITAKTAAPKATGEAALILEGSFLFGEHGGEIIKWRMLNKKTYKEDGCYLLLSEYIIDCLQYDNTVTDTDWSRDWSGCTLRAWLNNDFYDNAFSASEKVRILDTVVSGNGRASANDLPETLDKVYLLNTAEAKKYLSSYPARIAEGTAYAKSGGLWVNGKSLSIYETVGKSMWWLRNRGSNGEDFAAFVHFWGTVYGQGTEIDTCNPDDPCSPGGGVRPVICVRL